MSKGANFQPDWISPPGETIADILRERAFSVADFAREIGQSPEAATRLMEGTSPITISIARQLDRVLGGSVDFWISRDFQFREQERRLKDEWVAKTPVKDLIAFGWITSPSSVKEYASKLLEFFGLPTYGMWRRKYAALRELVAFRSSGTFESEPAALAAWLRKGEIEAQRIKCESWNLDRFLKTLGRIRDLTRKKDPLRFKPELELLCASCGVAVAIVRAPSGCRASGATWFLTKEKAILMLSARYLSDDQLWFTFFHEAGHLLQHGDRLFIEESTLEQTREEEEASRFASDLLIPPEHKAEFRNLTLDAREVIRFAVQIGISPGIVVGQMQHEKRIRYNQLNALKRRFQWGT